MTYFTSYKCIGCKSTDCTFPCPTAAFTNGQNCLLISSELCIDCGACVDQCPVEAILSSGDLMHIVNSSYDDLEYEQKMIKFFYDLNQQYGEKWSAFDISAHSFINKDCTNSIDIKDALKKFAKNLSGPDLEDYKEKVSKVFGENI